MTMDKDMDKMIDEMNEDLLKPKFYLMIGNIGSGKSTYITNKLSNATIVSKDGIRYAFSGGNYIFDRNLEPIVHSTSVFMARSLCAKQIEEIVLDETNITKKGRSTFINIAKEYDYQVIGIVLPKLDKEVAVARRLTNPHCQPDRELWENVWEKFDNKYNPPSKEEGFDQLIYLTKEAIM